MQLMVISSPVSFKGEGKLVNGLFENGLEVFHLRKPEIGLKDYRAFLQDIDPQYHDRVALHQFHELAADYEINRLHFPERLRAGLADQISGLNSLAPDGLSGSCKRKILSTSVHQVDDLCQLQDFDYAFLGPVFDSYSKLGYRGVFKDGFKDDFKEDFKDDLKDDFKPVSQKKTSVIALGGIGLNTIGRMKRMGFDGAAMLGWIWNDPLKAIDNFNQVKCWVKDHM